MCSMGSSISGYFLVYVWHGFRPHWVGGWDIGVSDTKLGHFVFVQITCMSPGVIVFFRCVIQRVVQLYDSLCYSACDSCGQRVFRVACLYRSVIPLAPGYLAIKR